MASASSLAIAFQFPMAINTLPTFNTTTTTTTTTILPHSSAFKQLRLSPCSPSTVTLINTTYTSLQAIKSHACGQTSELPDITWENLGSENPMSTDYMFILKCSEDGNFSDGGLQPFDTIEFNPAACVLNYGQGIFGELNAYKKLDNSIVLFRPEENGLSMRTGAERLCMPAPTVEQFVEAVKLTVLANTRWVPPPNKGFLHIKSLLLGNGPVLSVIPAPEFMFLIFVTPMANYFKAGGLQPVNLVVENEIHRAVRGGAGSVNAIGNYAANKTISTPALEGTILPGITRKSIIELACKQGYQVEERSVSVEELLEADEVFCTGNAVCLSHVGSITYLDKRVSYQETGIGGVSQQLYQALSNIQMGVAEDNMGWTLTLTP